MKPTEYMQDILSRRYSAVCLNADRQLASAARAADRASREMALVRECQTVIAKCGLGSAIHG